MPPTTLGDYIKRVFSSFGALAVLGAAFPVASILPTDGSAFLFPPLGDLTPYARIACVAAVLIVICCGYVFVGATPLKKWILLAAVLALIALFAYIYYSFRYVLKINTPNSFLLVSIGSEKTDFANRTFASGESAWDMVKMRGLNDEQVTKIWTAQSVYSNRLKLFFAYLVAAVCWAMVFALATAMEINSGARAQAPP